MYEKRYIAIGVSVFAIGVALGIFLNDCYTLSLCAVFAVLGIASVALLYINSKTDKRIISKRITAVVFTIAALSFGILRVFIQDALSDFYKPYDGCVDFASVQVVDISDSYIDGRIQTSDLELKKGTTIRVYLAKYDDTLLPGDVISGEMKYKYKNTNSLRSNGINLTASCESITVEKGRGILYSVRKSVNENSDALFGEFGDVAAISKGVTIGDRAEINSFIFASYQKAGISHLLAISGLHISIIVLSLFNLLSLLCVNRNFSSVLCIIVAFLFSALVGFSVGALRSAIMISAMLISRVLLIRSDSFTSLFIALMLFLVINPYSICSVGLQLSFLCCFDLIITSPLTNRINYYFSIKAAKGNRLKKITYKVTMLIISPMLTSTIASFFSYPIVFLNFNIISSISPLVNVLAIPLFTLALGLSVVAYIIATISIFAAKFFSYPAGLIFLFISNISKGIYNSNIGVVSNRSPIMSVILVLTIFSVVALIFINKRRNFLIISSCVVFSMTILVCGFVGGDAHKNIIEYNSEGGEYIYCQNEGNDVYIDIGGYSVYPVVAYENGKINLENYVMLKYNSLTYQHLDRMTSDISVSRILLPIPVTENDIYWSDAIKLLANERNCDIMYFDGGFKLSVSDDCEVQVAGVGQTIDKVTVHVHFGEISIQYLGDDFNGYVECDYVVMSKGCNIDISNIHANEIHAHFEYAYNNTILSDGIKFFDNKIKIEVNTEESSCRIYEP